MVRTPLILVAATALLTTGGVASASVALGPALPHASPPLSSDTAAPAAPSRLGGAVRSLISSIGARLEGPVHRTVSPPSCVTPSPSSLQHLPHAPAVLGAGTPALPSPASSARSASGRERGAEWVSPTASDVHTHSSHGATGAAVGAGAGRSGMGAWRSIGGGLPDGFNSLMF